MSDNRNKRLNALAAKRGPLAWMARNSVASNLLMLMFIIGGFLMILRVKQEVFPEVDLDIVTVNVALPGAAPGEVEQSLVLAIEEQLRGIDEVKEVNATAREGGATVAAELILGADPQRALQDIKGAVDRITTFPQDAERPIVALASRRRDVVSLIIYGDKTEKELRYYGEQMRNRILDETSITNLELTGVRRPEISIEVPQENLRRYNLTLDQVAAAIRSASVDVPGGSVKTRRGEVLLRTKERREFGPEFNDIVVLSQPNGIEVTVRDLGVVIDGFEESDRKAFFNGKRAVNLSIYRVGDQTPLKLSEEIRQFKKKYEKSLPDGVKIAVWNDRSEIYRDRINLLLRNAFQGLILVLIVLGLFLEIRLAFWVTLGIPISFLGAILFMPFMDVSLNMISLFAFILTLGIVVDDAIVVGEAVYKYRQEGMSPIKAAVVGAREVAVPVVFSVLTTVVAFAPLLFVPGVTGKFFMNIPMIVIPILLLSLVESLLILPAHLSHASDSTGGFLGFIYRAQQRFSDWVEMLIERFYQPFVKFALSYRYVTLAIGSFALILTFGIIGGGRLKFDFLPKIESDVISVNIRLPFGSSAEDTEAVMRRVLSRGQAAVNEVGQQDKHVRGIYSQVDTQGSHTAQVRMFLVSSDKRKFTSAQLTKKWRKAVGEVPGVDAITYNFTTGFSGGAPVSVELRHQDTKILESASTRLAERLKQYQGVFDVDDGFSIGKEQLDFKLKPAARALQITENDLGRQLRNAFFGASAGRQQRGRDEIRIFVRRPLSERQSEYNLDSFLIRTRTGGEIPLEQAATVKRGRSFTEIIRKNGRRQVNVTGDIDIKQVSSDEVIRDLKQTILPQLAADYGGLSYSFGGRSQSRRESLGSLRTGFLFALLIMFGLMSVVFKSYVQPLIIMMAIPFGAVGAVMGHLLLGYNLSIISIMGLVALAGVVVNDSLVLIDAVNQNRIDGMTPYEAVIEGGRRRFRPILLTSLTTFFGLVPMILETSVQARFLIPMALSLGFGVLFVTFIALILVPALYLAIEDARWLGQWIKALYTNEPITAGIHSTVFHRADAEHASMDEGQDGTVEAEGDAQV